jgi:hypothetical protein
MPGTAAGPSGVVTGLGQAALVSTRVAATSNSMSNKDEPHSDCIA